MSRPGSGFQSSYNSGKAYGSGSGYTPTKESSSNSNPARVEANDYVPKRFGLKYDPPTIILEYLIPSSGKLYHHKMKMPYLKADSDTYDVIEGLKKKHATYFVGNKVADAQIKNLVEKLKKKADLDGIVGGTFLTGGDDKKDTGLKLGKFAPINSSLNTKPTNTFSSGASKGGFGSDKKDDKKGGNDFWGIDDLEDMDDDKALDYNTVNLNKLSKEELQKHKNKMDVLFNKNYKKPGDAGFVYDKQAEFAPNEDNEWDEEL
jgi:hypothetical protein